MVRRLTVLGLIAAAFALLLPQAGALELGLAGIRLNQRALELLDLKGYGSPLFMGPVGAVTMWGVAPVETPAPGGGYGAAGYAPPAPGATPTARTSPFAFMSPVTPGTGYQQPSAAAPALPGALGALRFGFGRRSAGAASAAAPLAARPAAQPMAAAMAGTGGTIYWLYVMPGWTQVVAGIDASGRVSSIIVSGKSYPAAKTEGGVGLGDSYTSVLDRYGFPDTTQNVGDALVLGYRNAGLTLTLRNMRVQTIALAKPELLGEAAPGGAAVPMAPALGFGIGAQPAVRARPGAAAVAPGAGARGRLPQGFRLGFGRR